MGRWDLGSRWLGRVRTGGLTTVNEIRLWSHDNFGEDLIINPETQTLLLGQNWWTGTRAVEVSQELEKVCAYSG